MGSRKSNEIEDDKPNSDDGKFMCGNQLDEESEAGEAVLIESAMTFTETAFSMMTDFIMNEEIVDVEIDDQKDKENDKPQIEPNSQEDVAISSDVEEDESDEKNITNKSENSDVCEKESNDSKIEQEKIDAIEDDQPKSEADPPQEKGTESLKINEIEDDNPNSDDGKLIDDNQVDEETEKEAGEAGMIESAINSQEDVAISSDVEEDENDKKNITNKTENSD